MRHAHSMRIGMRMNVCTSVHVRISIRTSMHISTGNSICTSIGIRSTGQSCSIEESLGITELLLRFGLAWRTPAWGWTPLCCAGVTRTRGPASPRPSGDSNESSSGDSSTGEPRQASQGRRAPRPASQGRPAKAGPGGRPGRQVTGRRRYIRSRGANAAHVRGELSPAPSVPVPHALVPICRYLSLSVPICSYLFRSAPIYACLSLPVTICPSVPLCPPPSLCPLVPVSRCPSPSHDPLQEPPFSYPPPANPEIPSLRRRAVSRMAARPRPLVSPAGLARPGRRAPPGGGLPARAAKGRALGGGFVEGIFRSSGSRSPGSWEEHLGDPGCSRGVCAARGRGIPGQAACDGFRGCMFLRSLRPGFRALVKLDPASGHRATRSVADMIQSRFLRTHKAPFYPTLQTDRPLSAKPCNSVQCCTV